MGELDEALHGLGDRGQVLLQEEAVDPRQLVLLGHAEGVELGHEAERVGAGEGEEEHVGVGLVDGAEPRAEVLGVERRPRDADHVAAQLLEGRLELAAVRLPHGVVGVEDVDALAHLVDDVLREPVGLHPRVGLVGEVVLVELGGPHELGARDRVPVDDLVLLGHVHHRQRGAAGHGPDEELDVVLEDQLLGLAHGGGGLGLVVLRDDLDLVAEHAALGVQLLDGELDRHRLVLSVALEDADLGAEVTDLDDLLRVRRRRRPAPERERDDEREVRSLGHEPLLVDGEDVSMSAERVCAIRRSGSRIFAGSGAAAARRAPAADAEIGGVAAGPAPSRA